MLTCVQCTESFEWHGKRKRPLTCGAVCRRQRQYHLARERHWRNKGGASIEVRTCLRCGSSFEHARGPGALGRGSLICSDECRAQYVRARDVRRSTRYWNRLEPDEQTARRRAGLLKRYGLTAEAFNEMNDSQGGVCTICREPETKHHSLVLQIDHDRSCCPRDGSCGKCVRGLLCSNCNTALGLLGDDPERIRAAAEYLDRFASAGGAPLHSSKRGQP
jgi:hypothetical protein